jgi:Pectate lyase superfamily protein
MTTIVQKADLAGLDFANNNTNAAGGISVKTDATSAVGTAITAANVFLQAGTGAVARTLQAKARDVVSVKDFGAVGDGVTDDTAAIQAAIAFCLSKTTIVLEQVGSVTDVTTAIFPTLYIPYGRYKLSDELVCPTYFRVTADNAILAQVDTAKNIFTGSTAHIWNVAGVTFIGGKNHAHLSNGNVDQSVFRFNQCEFHLSSDYAVKTSATGGTYTHMSANLLIADSTFSRCKKILDNVCDSAIISNTWVYVDKTNFDANSAAIRNKGDSGHPQLYLKNFFGVPTMGVGGARLSGVRWVDNYGSFHASGSRFGGEDAGMAVVAHYKAPPSVYPFTGYEIVIRDSWLFCGPSANSDSGVVLLEGEMPTRITIEDCLGPIDVPYIVNISGLISDAYFSAWETAANSKAYNFFTVKVRNNSAVGSDGTVYLARIPLSLHRFVYGSKQTTVKLAAGQAITSGFVDNFVGFDTVIFDNSGGWITTSPTRLQFPLGVTRMRVNVFCRISGPAVPGIISIQLKNSSNVTIASSGFMSAINADDNGYIVSADVITTVPGADWLQVSVKTNAATALNLAECLATVSMVDHVG